MHTIGVAISTQGRESLRNTLMSIKAQGLIPGDRIIVIGDGIKEPKLDYIHKMVLSFGDAFQFINRPAEPGTWGHRHINWGFSQLQGTVDRICGQDDDDIFAPRAFDVVREASEKTPESMLMTRIVNHKIGLLWRKPEWGVPLFDNIYGELCARQGTAAQDGHSPFLPGHAERLPKFGDDYEGDQIFVLQTSLLFMNKTVWLDVITTITRPDKMLKWRLYPILVDDLEKAQSLRIIRNLCATDLTGFQGQITEDQQAKWFANRDPKLRAWLFTNGVEGDYYAGFCVTRPYKEDTWTVSYGVHPEQRGKGYGREIVQFAAFSGQGPLEGDALSSNETILKLDEEVGWERGLEHYLNGNLVTDLRLAWPPMKLIDSVIGFQHS